MATVEKVSTIRVAGGDLIKFKAPSEETGTVMTASIFLPKAAQTGSVPVLYYLSGLTCTDDNVCQKGGAFMALAEKGIAMICPDTSPRGAGVEGEDDSWDFGTGASFYLDATSDLYKKNYRMYTYITKELPMIIKANFPAVDATRAGIFGHSMGGMGALQIALKNQDMFKSVSAFAPMSNPSECAWGKKAFGKYIGEDEEQWKEWDPTRVMQGLDVSRFDDILIDVGSADNFYQPDMQLLPENFVNACKEGDKQKVTLRVQDGYDHSYFFISSFMRDHVEFHSTRL